MEDDAKQASVHERGVLSPRELTLELGAIRTDLRKIVGLLESIEGLIAVQAESLEDLAARVDELEKTTL